MAEMKISNTLVNDTKEGVIAYALQLKDLELNKFLSELNKNIKVVVDLKNYNDTTRNILPDLAKNCLFEYDGESVYTVPCMHNSLNCLIVYVCITKDSNTINKIFLMVGRLITQMYENEFPEWMETYLPPVIAIKVREIDNRTYWQ